MGWDFSMGATKKSVIASLMKGWESETSKVVSLAHCTKGNILWGVMETTTKATGETRKWISCSILGAEKNFGWGSKDMDESVHPYYFTCPLSYLEMAPVTCEAWRTTVRAYHAKMSVKLKVGDRVKLSEGCNPSELVITSIKPLRGCANSGTREYRLPRRMIAAVL